MDIKPRIIKYGEVSRMPDFDFGYHGWPSVCRADNGLLYAVCSGYRFGHICPFGKTLMFVSCDNGEKWSKPVIINDDQLDDRDAGLVSLGNGKLLVSWFSADADQTLQSNRWGERTRCEGYDPVFSDLERLNELPKEQRMGGSYVMLSRDYGVTWEEPVEVPLTAPHGPSVLHDGTVVYFGKRRRYKGMDRGGDIACALSSDDGKTWTEVGTVPVPEGYDCGKFHEPHVTELPSGKLFGVIRVHEQSKYHGLTVMTTTSCDKGKTWSMPKPINRHGTPPQVIVHSSGAIIISYGYRTEPFGSRAIISYDEGESYTEFVLNDKGFGIDLGYPCTVELPDKTLFTVYYQALEEEENPSVLYTKWALE